MVERLDIQSESELRERCARLERENASLQQAHRSVERLVQAVRDLSMARDLPTVQQIVRTAARQLNGADGASFVLREADHCFYADEDAIAPLWKGQRFPIETCISGWAMLNRQPAVIENIEADPRIAFPAYQPTFVKSLVMVPIRKEAPIGAIGNYWATQRMPTPAEVMLIQALADSTSIALENVQLYQDLERRVARRTAELEDLNQSLREFTYFASHDLRAPVRHVNAFADILEEDAGPQLGEEGRATLGKIRTSGKNMMRLLDSLLAMGQSGTHGLRPTLLNMNGVVASVVMQAKEHAPAATRFEIQELPPATADDTLLRQVWQNLIGNAIKFSSKNQHPLVRIGSLVREGEVRYFVQDNGAGFDMAAVGRLFKAFQRLHAADNFQGSGVGLAIVHRVISRHGGRVWAEGEPGKGATFYFTLPCAVP